MLKVNQECTQRGHGDCDGEVRYIPLDCGIVKVSLPYCKRHYQIEMRARLWSLENESWSSYKLYKWSALPTQDQYYQTLRESKGK